MSYILKLMSLGNSTAVILPKEVQTKMKVAKGDAVYLTETSDGFEMTPYDERFVKQVEAAEDFMKKYRDVLRELAK